MVGCVVRGGFGCGGREGWHVGDNDDVDDNRVTDWCETGLLLMQLERYKSGVRVVYACVFVSSWRDDTGGARGKEKRENLYV